MRLRTGLGWAAVAVLVAASDAEAQQLDIRGFGGAGFGGSISHMGLLQIETVQEAINMTDEQKEKLKAAGQTGRNGFAFGANHRPVRDLNLRDQPPEQRRDLFIRRRREQREERAKALEERAASVLNDEQMKRLNEIWLQAAGPAALEDPEVIAALKITDEQKEKLEAARGQLRPAQRVAWDEVRDLAESGEVEAARQKMAELRKEWDAITPAVLTDEQMQQLEWMKSKAIELTLYDLRGERGGRGGGGQ